MHGIIQKRRDSRWNMEGPIVFVKPDSEELVKATMRNISENGLYFESRHDIAPYSDICIWMEDETTKKKVDLKIYDFYRSRVRWRRVLNNNDGLGFGVQHVARTMGVAAPEFYCNLCEKKISMGKVHFERDFLYLCPTCHVTMRSCRGGCRDEILRILEGNVF